MARKKSATVDLKVRMKEPLRAKLEVAAKRAGVSLNAEAVKRMDRSFERDETFAEAAQALFGFRGEAIMAMRSLGRAIAIIEKQTGLSWREDWNTAEQVRYAFRVIIEVFGPEPPFANQLAPSTPVDQRPDLKNQLAGRKAVMTAVKEELPRLVEELGLEMGEPKRTTGD